MSQKKAAPAPQVETIDRTLVDQMIADAMAKDSARKERESMQTVEMTEAGLKARDMSGLYTFAQMVFRARLAPKGFETAEACFVAMAKGAEVGLSHMESLASIAVINGRPAIWGDAMLALAYSSGLLADYRVEWHGKPDTHSPDFGCTVTVQRKGMPSPITETWTVARAGRAGLWGKAGPWTQYPERMLEMRARSFALRNAFPDKLRGLISVEEAHDIPEDIEHAVETSVREVESSANPLDQVMALHGGGDKSSNGEVAETEPAPTPDDVPDPEPDEPEDEPKCSPAQGKRLALLGAKLFPKVATKEMPAHLSGLGWAWNEGPLAEPVSRFGELSEQVAGEMIAELEVLVSEAEEA